MNKIVILKKNEERRINSGHQWIFSNEIFEAAGEPENGDLVNILDSRHNLLGCGFYNKNSLIAVRFLSSGDVEDLYQLFKTRIVSAYNYRKNIYPDRESFRLIFSESDFIPGLIIDKYNDTFVLQVYSIGIEKNIEEIVKVLQEELNAKNVFTKNETYFRTLEGLPVEDKILLGEKNEEIISDGLISYKINFDEGHKTGFYFDQSDNRYFIEKLVSKKTVLDAFCNAGGFGMHAAKAGASKVIFVDSSAIEIENAKNNFALNNLETEAEFIHKDVFDFFDQAINKEEKYDVVMVDPPAFAKNKKSLPVAKKGYEKLNRLALKLVNSGGYLVTSSCSHHLHASEFLSVINTAAIKTGKKIQQVHFNEASLDHLKVPAMPETSYLKFAVFLVTPE
ncbi:MAG: class I SAM-dependent rRNA methyltransferase [Ignavibacteriaceae bacterium]|nr:class I SAM-dependent rRNA methyltransferase [Ignavibacteriaceae bacterium]